MKKSFLFVAAIFLATGLFAQEKFTVPEVTIEQKYRNLLYQYDGLLSAGINYAKMQGLTAAEYGTLIGEQFRYGWDKDAGFDGFVGGVLVIMSVFLPEPEIEITTNTAERVEYKTRLFGMAIGNDWPLFEVTYEEYMNCLMAILYTIGDHMGVESEINYDEEWLYFKASKKL